MDSRFLLLRRTLLPFLLLSLFLAGCTQRPPLKTRDIEVYFSRHHDIPKRLVEIIEGTERELMIASFDADLPCVFSALSSAKTRGVKVRMMIDKNNTDLVLPFASDSFYTDTEFPHLMHAKFGSADGRIAWVCSSNLTFASVYQNDNDLVIFNSPQVAEYLKTLFNSWAKDKPVPKPFCNTKEGSVEIYPSPYCKEILRKELTSAQKEIFFSLYLLSDPEIIRILCQKSREGIRVTGILEREWRGNEKVFAELKRLGVKVSWDRNYYLNHYKLFVVDNSRVITGSYNPSVAAKKNREILVVLNRPEVAKFYLQMLK